MSRPQKKGIDYYSMDATFLSDRKIRRILRKCGYESAAILVSLLGFIYRGEGYYVVVDDELFYDIEEELKGVPDDKIKEVIQCAVDCNLFDEKFYNSDNILTSAGIQRRYLEATKRRKNSGIHSYCILNVDNNGVNVCKNSINADNNGVNVCKSTQSKVKKSKVKERKVNQTKSKDILPQDFSFSELLNFVNFRDELLADQFWVEGLCAEFDFKKFEGKRVTPDEVPRILQMFGIAKRTERHSGWETVEKFIKHFKSWLNLKIRIQYESSNRDQANYTTGPATDDQGIKALERLNSSKNTP